MELPLITHLLTCADYCPRSSIIDHLLILLFGTRRGLWKKKTSLFNQNPRHKQRLKYQMNFKSDQGIHSLCSVISLEKPTQIICIALLEKSPPPSPFISHKNQNKNGNGFCCFANQFPKSQFFKLFFNVNLRLHSQKEFRNISHLHATSIVYLFVVHKRRTIPRRGSGNFSSTYLKLYNSFLG